MNGKGPGIMTLKIAFFCKLIILVNSDFDIMDRLANNESRLILAHHT
jgi:hypothetical protein